MKTPFLSSVRRRWFLPLAVLCMMVASVTLSRSQNLSWSNPSGSVTLFGAGDLATALQTRATLADVDVADSLVYLDAGISPAVLRSDAMKGDASFSSVAQLSVGESQTDGMPFTSGRIDFSSVNGAVGTGSGSITLYFLISVPTPALIELSGLRSSVTTDGLAETAFSLSIFESDAMGAKFGDAVLSFAGNYFDAGDSFQSSAPYYLLQMNVAANATVTSSDAIEFSYFLDLAPITAVPEPGSTALLCVAILMGLVFWKARRGVCPGRT